MSSYQYHFIITVRGLQKYRRVHSIFSCSSTQLLFSKSVRISSYRSPLSNLCDYVRIIIQDNLKLHQKNVILYTVFVGPNFQLKKISDMLKVFKIKIRESDCCRICSDQLPTTPEAKCRRGSGDAWLLPLFVEAHYLQFILAWCILNRHLFKITIT